MNYLTKSNGELIEELWLHAEATCKVSPRFFDYQREVLRELFLRYEDLTPFELETSSEVQCPWDWIVELDVLVRQKANGTEANGTEAKRFCLHHMGRNDPEAREIQNFKISRKTKKWAEFVRINCFLGRELSEVEMMQRFRLAAEKTRTESAAYWLVQNTWLTQLFMDHVHDPSRGKGLFDYLQELFTGQRDKKQ